MTVSDHFLQFIIGPIIFYSSSNSRSGVFDYFDLDWNNLLLVSYMNIGYAPPEKDLNKIQEVQKSFTKLAEKVGNSLNFFTKMSMT